MSKDPPFLPQTGNPEAHDYLDWYRHLLRSGQVAARPVQDGTPPPAKPPGPPDGSDAT